MTQTNLSEAIKESPKESTSTSIEKLMKFWVSKHLLSHLDSSSDAISNFVKLGSAFTSYLAFWIIASEANRHMTDSYFVNYSLCSNQDSVPIADGSFTLISRTCIVCTPNIKLSFALHIPYFPIIFYLSVL